MGRSTLVKRDSNQGSEVTGRQATSSLSQQTANSLPTSSKTLRDLSKGGYLSQFVSILKDNDSGKLEDFGGGEMEGHQFG